MHLSCSWTRYKPTAPASGGFILGTDDPVPTGFIDGRDNILGMPNRYDQPAKRLGVVCTYAGAGPAPASFTYDVYAWDSTTSSWQKVNAAAATLTLGVMSFISLPTLVASRNSINQGSKFYIRIIAAGTESAGTYLFAADGIASE